MHNYICSIKESQGKLNVCNDAVWISRGELDDINGVLVYANVIK